MIRDVPLYIRRAARAWQAWRRKRQWMREMGIDDLTTKIAVGARQHRATEPARSALRNAVHAKLDEETGWEPRHG